MSKPKRASKPIEKWTGADFVAESCHLNGDKDKGSDAVVCGAMMLAALREGPGSLRRLSKATGIDYERLRPFYTRLREQGIFGLRKIKGQWFDEDTGSIGFLMDVCVGLQWLERCP